MRHIASVFTLVLLASCAAQERHRQPVYSTLLSASDIARITALVAERADIRLPIAEIRTEGQRRDAAIVYTGRWREAGDRSEWFTVQKRHGRWHILPPIRRDQVKPENILTVS